jgi:type IV pilus modification protein PilV
MSPDSSCSGAGLTLLELLFAVSVISVTLLGVAGMFPSALRSVVSGGQVTKATILAQEMIDMIRNDPFDTLVTRYSGFNTQTLTAGCPVSPAGFDPDSNKKKWKCDLLATEAQDSGRGLPGGFGTVTVACLNADGSVGSCSGTDLRQVTVTVRWDRTGSRSVSLVSYVVRME